MAKGQHEVGMNILLASIFLQPTVRNKIVGIVEILWETGCHVVLSDDDGLEW